MTAAKATSIRTAPLEVGDHVELARRLVASLRGRAPVTFTDGGVFQYRPGSGIFEIVPPAELSVEIQAFSGMKVKIEKKPLRLKASDIGGTIKLTSDLLSDPEFFSQPKRGIAFQDCFVEVDSTQIHQRNHSPEHRARYAYPWKFEQGEPAAWLAFLEQVFQGDEDAAQKVDLLQEYIGASLLGLATRYQRAVVLLGDGANGKGVFSSVVEQCMPPGSVCAIPPQDAGQEYRRAMLAGKLLNVVSELPEADILDSESWKSIVAGDTTTGRPIRQEPFTFKPVAGHIYSANRLPGTTDQSHGFWRRLLVVKFNRVFEEHEQDAELADRLVRTQTKGIVSWALAGAQRILGQGRYTVPASSQSAVEDWKRAADQVRAFVDDWTQPLGLDEPITNGCGGSDLYKAYRGWSLDNGHKPMASNKFGERMRLLKLEAQHTRLGNYYPVKLARGWGS